MSSSGLMPVAQGVAWRTIKNVVTSPAILLPSLLFPLFMFTAFAGGLSQVQELPGFDFENGYTAFQFVFVLLQSAAFGGVFTGFGIARDFEGGFARRLLLASPRRSGIVLGYAIAAFLRWAIVASAVTVVALLAGMEVSGDPAELMGMYSLALLVNVCGFMWSAGIAMRFRSIQAGPLMQMPVFIVLFFAPVYVPLDLLTGAMHAVAVLNPITYVLEAGRSLISGEPAEVALAFVLAAALAGLLVLWAFRGLRRAEAAG
ncbi:MAG TPA: ABC transporter permease [Gaiella sp.]|nr:ABC transporter permease [Gaiella sp.]